MSQRIRIAVAITLLVLLIGGVLAVDGIQRVNSSTSSSDGQVTIPAGSIPIFVDGRLVAGFTPDDLERLEEVSFVDAEEGKTQQGWMLRDVILFNLAQENLRDDVAVVLSSSSRGKSVRLTWSEIETSDNMVMFDLSSRGTLKLVSLLERLNTRDEWVQDVDKIEVSSP